MMCDGWEGEWFVVVMVWVMSMDVDMDVDMDMYTSPSFPFIPLVTLLGLLLLHSKSAVIIW